MVGICEGSGVCPVRYRQSGKSLVKLSPLDIAVGECELSIVLESDDKCTERFVEAYDNFFRSHSAVPAGNFQKFQVFRVIDVSDIFDCVSRKTIVCDVEPLIVRE